MIQAKSIFQEKNSDNPYLFINLIFGFFPISFILGSLIVNLNFLLFCCLGIYYLKSKILTIKLNFSIKIIFLFFLILFLSSALSLIKSLYFDEYVSLYLIRLVKSALFFRFFLFLIIVYLLSRSNILHFKYFFIIAAFSSVLLSLDIIYQHYFGLDIVGLKSHIVHNPGFFGGEAVAGGYLLRFGFFAIFFTILVFKNKNYTKFISTVIVICVVGTGILFSGNRMPLILFIFGLFLVFLLNLKIKKILLLSLVVLSVLFKFIISSDESYKNHIVGRYSSLIEAVENTFLTPFDINLYKGKGIQSWRRTERIDEEKSDIQQKTVFYKVVKIRSSYLRFALAAWNTWKFNKIFGNGIKSFYTDCHKLSSKPNVRLEEDQFPDKNNLLCSNHPHNYYFQILTTTGIVGLFITLSLACLFLFFIFKNFKFIKKNNTTNIILLSAVVSFFLEMFPIRSTGSFYTTNNITYIILIGSIILSYKDLSKVK